MRKREVIAWLLVTVNALGAAYLGRQLRVSKAERLETAELTFECGVELEKLGEICSEEGAEYMKRGNLIFECQESLCKVNGWTPPFDFDESLEGHEGHKEQP